jgi:hypothetical protein
MPRRFSCFILEMCMKKSEWLAIGMRKNASLREREERGERTQRRGEKERERETNSLCVLLVYYSPTSFA